MKPIEAISATGLPTPAQGTEVASYRTYAEAQAAVDHLSDQAFDVRGLAIVGTDLQLVERITGRLTWGKVLWDGFLSGIWLGLFIGLFSALWSPNASVAIVLVGMAMGAVFGMTLASVPYAFTRGKRDFTSATQVVASRYAILAKEGAVDFRQVLRSTPGNLTRDPQPTHAVEDLSKPSAFGSRPGEQPKYGVRLSPSEREAHQARMQAGENVSAPVASSPEPVVPKSPAPADPVEPTSGAASEPEGSVPAQQPGESGDNPNR
ncbi:general stress protein [Gleimia europaea]|uniref:General stress protein 17M-like domain-containing protein n=1 Tax=Gleimia europaea ACS-120-V-Col10b TaxID=883069 RepID=A0A9W5RED5_9ACTO|nr:general stress protein [Gleimia europaea]EPD30909.1 hypothetical protein HMPREF9238_00664 [Gleimia europaea ACS-120-V-Col10b]